MTENQKAYVQFHLAVILWGFTAILGDLITLSALVLVWWRVGMSGLGLSFVGGLWKRISEIDRSSLKAFIFIGILVAAHWVCFYGSIKLANASIALVTMATTALFTLILESFFTGSSIRLTDILFGLMVIPPIWIIAEGLDPSLFDGVFVGLAAAFLLALFTVLNKKYIRRADPVSITFIEMTVAWVFLGIVMVVSMLGLNLDHEIIPTGSDLILLLVLSVFCTIVPFILSLRALRHLSAYVTNLIFNLEPVYGIMLAAILLKDFKELHTNFYIGAGILFLLVFVHPMMKAKIPGES